MGRDQPAIVFPKGEKMMDFFINAALYLMVFGFPVLVLAWALMNGMEAFIDFIDKETLFMSQTVDSATGNGKLYYLTRTERGKNYRSAVDRYASSSRLFHYRKYMRELKNNRLKILFCLLVFKPILALSREHKILLKRIDRWKGAQARWLADEKRNGFKCKVQSRKLKDETRIASFMSKYHRYGDPTDALVSHSECLKHYLRTNVT
jgi:hypothetical protein